MITSGLPKALIVCSNRSFSARVAEIISPLGCQVTRAFSISAVAKNFDGHQFDLLLLGLVRADDQTEVLSQLRSDKTLRDVPLVFLIAPDLNSYAPELGKFLEMRKPITDLASFTEEAARLLDRSRPDRYQALSAAQFDFYEEKKPSEIGKLRAAA